VAFESSSLKGAPPGPFNPRMSSVSNALATGQLQIALTRKQLDSLEQQERDALQLIAAAAPPILHTATRHVQPGVGTRLNVVA
jgi:hypothetical protein